MKHNFPKQSSYGSCNSGTLQLTACQEHNTGVSHRTARHDFILVLCSQHKQSEQAERWQQNSPRKARRPGTAPSPEEPRGGSSYT